MEFMEIHGCSSSNLFPENPEEEIFPEKLLAVERVDEVSSLADHEKLMIAIKNFEYLNNEAFEKEFVQWEDSTAEEHIEKISYKLTMDCEIPGLQENTIPMVNTGLSDFPTTINTLFELQKLNEEEQKTVDINEEVDIKKEVIPKITGNIERTTDIELKTDQETKEKEFKCPASNTLPVSQEINKRNTNIKKKNQNVKGKRKKKENSITINHKKVKSEEQEDVETIVLEAVDEDSLLEKFEASLNSKPRNKSTVKNNRTYDSRSNKPCQVIQECRTSVSEKSVSQASTLQKNVHNSLSKDLIDKIKASEYKKKSIPIIPAMPNIQDGNRRNSVRTQDGASRNKIMKTNSTVTNNAKSRILSNALVQLDHDYCSSANFSFHTKNCNNNKTTKYTSIKSSQNKSSSLIEERQNSLSSNVYYNLKPVNICGINKKPQKPEALQNKIKDNLLENNHKDCQKEIFFKQSHDSSNSLSIKNINSNESPSFSATLQTTIRSALAKRILQSDGILPKTNIVQTSSKTQHMISVLKNPPNASQSPFSTNNFNENIVTTTNSLNNEVQNIIVQNTQNTLPHEEVKTGPPRTRINLEEYYRMKNKNKIIQKNKSPTVLVDIYHAATMTVLIIKDNSDNPEIWCEREFIRVNKAESEIEAEKSKPKPPTCDAEAQTDKTIFEFSTNTVVDVVDEEDKKRKESTKNNEQESCKRLSHSRSRSKSQSRKTSRSRSRSRRRSRDRKRSRSYSKSKSRSRSKSRTRSRNRNRSRNITRSRSTTRSRSRSRSRRRSNTRRRTISHRRSSVSSTGSWSSPSHSTKYSYSSSSSRSRNVSRSRSRSRSRSPRQHYSSRSRSSSSSNFGRNRWSNHRGRNSSDRERNYDRYRRFPWDISTNPYRNHRSPLRSCHKPYDNWYNREKQREVNDRRVIYVGGINEGITRADLRRRFEIFGPIVDISLHFREYGDNYGFVTFKYNNDAYRAKEHGNDNPSLPRYDLCFGNRRAFCKSTYADLDDMRSNAPITTRLPQTNEVNFDYLLEEAKADLHKRKV